MKFHEALLFAVFVVVSTLTDVTVFARQLQICGLVKLSNNIYDSH